MKTEILPTRTAQELEHAVETAVRLLREGEVVALPTETVYGLAADAANVAGALKIFEAKERPRFDPLIVHLPDPDSLAEVARVAGTDANLMAALTRRFWPGPLTIILPRQATVPDVVTAGLDTVAVRVSAHPVFSRIVRAFGGPLAAPSANRFGRISPTSAEHVLSELGGRIPLIIDAGTTQHGLESTIVAISDGAIEILRPGPITPEELSQFATTSPAAMSARMQAPGQLSSHYAPRTPLRLVADIATFVAPPRVKVGALSLRDLANSAFAETRALSASGDLRDAAANLFSSLRELDAAGLDLIVAEEISETGLGHAIMDRLRRASDQL